MVEEINSVGDGEGRTLIGEEEFWGKVFKALIHSSIFSW
jgi:hypothetical protein